MSAKHTVPLIGWERGGKNTQEGGKMPFPSWAAQQQVVHWHGLHWGSKLAKWDGQTEEQEEDFRPEAQLFAVSSCFIRPLRAKADRGRPSPRQTARHSWGLGCPQQRGDPILLRWLFPNHHQLRSFTQWGKSWTRLRNDKNTCLFKNLFSDQNESQLPAPPSPLLWRHKYLQISVFFF